MPSSPPLPWVTGALLSTLLALCPSPCFRLPLSLAAPSGAPVPRVLYASCPTPPFPVLPLSPALLGFGPPVLWPLLPVLPVLPLPERARNNTICEVVAHSPLLLFALCPGRPRYPGRSLPLVVLPRSPMCSRMKLYTKQDNQRSNLHDTHLHYDGNHQDDVADPHRKVALGVHQR